MNYLKTSLDHDPQTHEPSRQYSIFQQAGMVVIGKAQDRPPPS
jgi:hypothetical protein